MTTHLIKSWGDYESPQSIEAAVRSLTGQLDGDEATTYTSDTMYEALGQLRDAADRKIAAVDHVRGSRRLAKAT